MSQMSSRAGLVALALAAACLATAPLATAGVADDEATVSGHIRDARTGAAIAGARVACGERSTTTSGDGAFSLSLPRGEASLEVTAAGYTSKAVAIVAGAGRGVSVALAPALRFQERMDVEASGQSTTAPSPLAVRPVQVLAAAGAVDNVFRVLQFLPGVTGTDEFTSRLSVRGGGPDENLTVMDGVEIANPYRLQGLVSAFNPETIESFSLDTGSFGVARGDRLSSLLVVQNRAGTEAKAVAGSTALSITDANVVLEGRLPRTRGSWLVTGRRTYYDPWWAASSTPISPPSPTSRPSSSGNRPVPRASRSSACAAGSTPTPTSTTTPRTTTLSTWRLPATTSWL
jgi:hypothetical protein